jgi:hypothetical protein
MVGGVIQGLIVLNNEDTYTYQAWHATLLTIAVIVFASMFNTVLAVRLPVIEGALLALHVVGLFAIIIPLWVMAPRGNLHDTLLKFTTTAGWSDVSLASLVGMVSVVAILVGYDCTVYMCEYIAILGNLLYADSLTSSGRSARRFHSTSESPHLVYRTKRDHGSDHGSHIHLLHRRNRQCARKPDERALHPGLLQRHSELRWRDHHGINHCDHAYLCVYQRGCHCFSSALVLCS